MNRLIKYILLLLLVVSCNNNSIDKPKKPKNLISEGKMVAVLYDMALINAAKGTNKKILEENKLNPERYVFNKHNIDSLQFVESNAFYAFDIDTYKSIYNRVSNKLKKDQTYYQKILDSIAKAKEEQREKQKKEVKNIDLDVQLDSTLIRPKLKALPEKD